LKIAEYFASIGLRVDNKDVAKVDKFLANVGKNLKTSISGTEGLEKAVKKETKTAVDGLEKKAQAQKKVAQQIAVTAKNQRAWNKEFTHSIKNLTPSGSMSRRARQDQLNAVFGAVGSNPRTQRLLNSRLSYLPGGKSDELSNMAAHYRNEQKIAALKERVRREEESSARRIMELRQRDLERRTRNQQRIERQAVAHQQSLERIQARAASRQQGSAGRSDASYGRANYLHAGGAAGAFARYGMASLPFVGGVYGLGTLNTANREGISARLTTQAVVEAAGLQGRGEEAFGWLRNQANRIGFSYMDQSQDYNNFLSNSLGAGLGLEESQDIYLGFAEYSKAMGITPARQKLVMNALSQMQGKGVLSMEELRRQMAESMPG